MIESAKRFGLALLPTLPLGSLALMQPALASGPSPTSPPPIALGQSGLSQGSLAPVTPSPGRFHRKVSLSHPIAVQDAATVAAASPTAVTQIGIDLGDGITGILSAGDSADPYSAIMDLETEPFRVMVGRVG